MAAFVSSPDRNYTSLQSDVRKYFGIMFALAATITGSLEYRLLNECHSLRASGDISSHSERTREIITLQIKDKLLLVENFVYQVTSRPILKLCVRELRYRECNITS